MSEDNSTTIEKPDHLATPIEIPTAVPVATVVEVLDYDTQDNELGDNGIRENEIGIEDRPVIEMYCGCCDYRRVVLIMNSIRVFLFILLSIQVYIHDNRYFRNFGISLAGDNIFYNEKDYDNDEEYSPNPWITLAWILGIGFVELGGPLLWSACLLALSVVVDFVVFTIWSYAVSRGTLAIGFSSYVAGVVFCAIHAYPIIVLITQIKEKRLTKKNYAEETYCYCCCWRSGKMGPMVDVEVLTEPTADAEVQSYDGTNDAL